MPDPAVPHGPSPLTPSTVCGSACLGTVAALATPLLASAAISIALPLPDTASASVTRGDAKIPFCNLFQAKSFSRGSLLTLDCPCTATQMEPHQICSRLGFRGQCRPLVRPFLVASLAVTRRTTGINKDLTTTQGTTMLGLRPSAGIKNHKMKGVCRSKSSETLKEG